MHCLLVTFHARY